MSLKLTYYGQNDSVNCTPAVFLTGDPGTDQQTLTSAGYLGGVIVSIISSAATLSAPLAFQPGYEPAFGSIGNIVPCDAAASSNAYGITSSTLGGCVPFATLLNGPGEFAGAIGPSGSRKAPVVRALWQGNVDFQGYDSAATFTLGLYVYCGGTGHTNIGKYTSYALSPVPGTNVNNALPIPVGICTHVPSASEPWLGVASLI
jgi:hypothetical protein